MDRFTDAIRKSISDQNWFAALFLSLCMPDICGSLETPDEQVGPRYKRWFGANLATSYSSMFSAEDCYSFRCSCLHQGLDTHQRMSHERIHFITPPPRGNVVHCNMFNNVLQLQIDIFCEDVAMAVDSWYEAVKNNPEIQARVEALIKIYGPESLQPFIAFQ
ncbi:MAG: hypothetical protein V1907_00415 [Candidatus Kerfeldbacteria bacterium]